jgi:hypothetical protein
MAMGKLSENQKIEVDILSVKCWLGEVHFILSTWQ